MVQAPPAESEGVPIVQVTVVEPQAPRRRGEEGEVSDWAAAILIAAATLILVVILIGFIATLMWALAMTRRTR